MKRASAVRRTVPRSVPLPLGRRRDVQKDDLVGAFPFVTPGEGHGIADVPQIAEVRALHDPSVIHVQADDDTRA